MSRLTLIVAATASNGIGKDAGLPWRLPKEMAYFARATAGAPAGLANAVIMGRNTWESIPLRFRPLRGRANAVVSRNTGYDLCVCRCLLRGDRACAAVADVRCRSADASVVDADTSASLHADLRSALDSLEGDGGASRARIHRRFVIGGASLYAEALALPPLAAGAFVDRVLLTRILSPAFDCDVFMPDFLEGGSGGAGGRWERASDEELSAWVGFDVPMGVQEERGVRYEFQMWTRRAQT